MSDDQPRGDDKPIPRLPRGKGITLSGPAVFRIVMFAALLIGVVVLREPCAQGIGTLFEQFEPPPDAGPPTRTAAPVSAPAPHPAEPGGFVRITRDMSDEEIRAALQRAGIADPARARDAGAATPVRDAGAATPGLDAGAATPGLDAAAPVPRPE